MKKLTKMLGILLLAAMPLCASAQNVTVKGSVKDAAGQPVIGAGVVQQGTTNGTVTDLDGKYVIAVPASASLSFSSVGYVEQVVAVAGRNEINVVLAEDAEMLEETVVIGYGVQRKSDLTGAVASVNSESLKVLSTTDAGAALQGKVAGVNVIMNGAPGEGAEIRVRGYSSNGGSLSPLYIVDGLQVSSIQYLDPSMIESMEILKDAASAAIYGAEAGNGVVLITTKTGSDSKASVTYSGKFTNQNFRGRPLMNREELIKYVGLEYIDDPNYMSSRLAEYDYKHPDYAGGVIDTDWIGAYFEPSWSQQHAITFSGGNKSGHFFVSLNYVDQNGVVKGDRDTYKRLTAQVNADYQLFKWLQVGTTNSIEKWSTRSVSQRGYSSSFESVINYDPTTPVYWHSTSEMSDEAARTYAGFIAGTDNHRLLGDDKGWYAISKYNDVEGNPLSKIIASEGSNGGFNINGTMYLNLTPVKGLTITSRLGYRLNQSASHSYTSPYYIGRGSQDNYSISATANTGWYYQWENFANYNVTIAKKHNITAMVGMSYRETNSDNVTGSASGADILSNYDPAFQYLNYVKSDATKSISNAPGKSASLAYFGRLIYSYDNRYSIQANFRADAFDSSKLSAKNRWGYFPSVSAGWTISNERWIKDNVSRDALSFLKLRASWGRNGNVNVLSGYRYATTISAGSNWYQYGVATPGSTFSSAPNYGGGLPNPNLKWETSEQIDLGLDARFLRDRLTFGVDYYNKKTKDLLFSVNVPTELGATSTTVNGGTVLNEGLEFELGWRDHVGDFSYGINANFSTLHNEVLSLAARAARITNSGASSTNYSIMTAFETGYPVWYLLGYKYAGVGNSGEALYYDKDGKVTDSVSDADMTFMGSTTPTFTYGLNINLAYKGFDFTLNGYGQGGNYIVPVTHRTGVKNNFKYYLQNSWTESNKSAKLPAPDKVLAANVPFWSSTGNMFKGDYFRIQTLQLGYTLPSKITKKALISNLRFYVSLDDFFTFTKYPGLDPSTASMNSSTGGGLDWGSYPTMQKVVLGVNLTF
ncbi:MAG: TonB-dependent receptor [Bacteroidales bacterium]|nr:TonB-dependent receptor [Bacteroidales bacterium]